MKYQVQIQYTNPAHEHVSLRRRVDSINRIVEASSEEEALNRAANQQRALGFKIQEAKVVKPDANDVDVVEKKKKKVVGNDNEKTEISASGGVKEELLPKQKAVADRLKASEIAANKEKAGYKYGKALRATKVAAKKLKEDSELGYIEEKLTAADPASKWISDFVASDNPKFAGKSKKERIQQALGAYYAAKRGTNEEVEPKEVESIDEGMVKALKKAQTQYRSTHRAAFGKDPTVKSAIVTGIAKLAGAKTKTARAIGAAVGGKKVSKQQQTAAASRVGKKAVSTMREEVVEKEKKGKKAAEKMTLKAAESRKKSIEGNANKVNMKPMIDLNKTGEK